MAFKDARRERGLYRAEVLRTERVTPHMMRVTVAGDDLTRLPHHGYDQWFRLFLPRSSGDTDFSAVPEQFGVASYVKFLLNSPAATRPVVRSYTVRAFRPDAGEVDIDFVTHGDLGEAGPWATRAQPGERVMLLDQGRGFDPLPSAGAHLFAGDESALPAILGILRDLPRDARGVAVLEVIDADDAQPHEAPDGVAVRWIARDDGARPGSAALAALQGVPIDDPGTLVAYLAGEQTLPAEGRRHLVSAGVPKNRIVFTGYWRLGKAAL